MPHHHLGSILLQGDYLEELQRKCGDSRFTRTHSIPTKKADDLRKRLQAKLKAKKN